MDFNKYMNKGLSGLTNLGNTCFINSCMQIISHTYELNSFLDLQNYQQKLNNNYDSALLIEWDNLRKMLWSENCVISPNKFINIIHKIAKIKNIEVFTDYTQNDISEFLIFLLDCFHNSLSRGIKMTITGKAENETDKIALLCYDMLRTIYSDDYSEIWNMFYAVHISEIKSITTNKILKIIPESFFTLNLPIPQNINEPTLCDCFNLYVEEEVLNGENGYVNEETNIKEDITKKILFWSLPNILVIILKRFNSNNKKNQKLVNFTINNYDLSKYVIGYKKDEYVYDLYGIANHSGSVLGGHYTAYVKNANHKWYHFNDTSVTEINEINSIITSKAYCLFYRKKTI